jgi:hypothetical protein
MFLYDLKQNPIEAVAKKKVQLDDAASGRRPSLPRARTPRR